ncbi:MAG: ABC transporter ATP-binding protein [Actinomycetes bacterium]
MTTVLSLSEVTVEHRDGEETLTALDDVSLDVAAGEIVAIVGASGSGKSTLLAVAGALTTPTSGTVHIDDIDLSACTPRQRTAIRCERVGFVFQSDNLIPALTALDQLRLPLTFGRATHPDGPRDPAEMLASVGMEHKAGRRPHQLSGGERQRIGIARALMTRPRVLLVDEPTAALDRERSQEVGALLAREAQAHGVAAVMVTHDHDVLHHCDRVLTMIDGRLAPTSA